MDLITYVRAWGWIHLDRNRIQWRGICESDNEHLRSMKGGEFLA
jgi:hypothetical protein